MTSRSAGRSQSGRGEDRRALILAAAQEQFAHYGYRGASLEEIAKAAGVSRPALYQYFPGKEELFREIASSLHAEVLDRAEAALTGAGDLGSRLRKALEIKSAVFHDALWSSRHGPELFDAGGRVGGDLAAKFRASFTKLLQRFLDAAAAAGEVDTQRLGLSRAEAASFLFNCAEGLHERYTGEAVAPRIYRKRLDALTTSVLGAIAIS